jgi:hypothetical protein
VISRGPLPGRPARGHAVPHPPHADVLVHIRPVRPFARPHDEDARACSGVASDRRHDHANGTLVVRPSLRTTAISSSETLSFALRESGAHGRNRHLTDSAPGDPDGAVNARSEQLLPASGTD